MDVAWLEAPEETEGDRVIEWRVHALLRAGYDGMTALDLALTPEIDLHEAIDLLRRGCSPGTAVRILL